MSNTFVEGPLAQTLARARRLSAYLQPQVGEPGGEGWAAALDPLRADRPLLAQLVAATQARLRTRSAAMIGSALLQGYQWPLIGAAVACYLIDRRVPDLSAANVLVRYGAAHDADALALRSGRFTALPDDPAAAHPDATVVAGREALREALRAGVEAHMGEAIALICAHLGCGPRGLWLSVADRLAGTLIWLMQAHGQAPAAQIENEVEALIRAPGSPLSSRQIGLIALTHHGRSEVFLDRATCCYWYRTDGGEYCSTCPRRPPAERRELLLRHMAEASAAQGDPAEVDA
jgi:Ferric iron reductase FhuF-like transporter/FhuF 2Fe-2S C-terminal domain